MKWTISRQKDFRRLLWHLELLFFHPYGQYWHLLSECVGSVALICAGLYVANGNQSKDAFKIATGFLLGDIWAVIAIWIMETLSWNPNAELYTTLFIMGGLAVIIGETLGKYIFTPAWLCGWAIGLTIMGPLKIADIGSLPIQIGISMIAGVVYVGIGVDTFQKFFYKKFQNTKN